MREEKKIHPIKFNLLNLEKSQSLYENGMRILVWSKKRHETEGIGWHRAGLNISYSSNHIPRSYKVADGGESMSPIDLFAQDRSTRTFHTLSFTYEFEAHGDDEVWFAHSLPYTYTEMNEQLSTLKENKDNSSFLRVGMLGLTLGKLPIPLLTITDNVDTYFDYAEEVRLFNELPSYIKRSMRFLYRSVYDLIRQSKQLRGES